MKKEIPVEIKAFSINIEPMYVGTKKDKRKEVVVSMKIFQPDTETFKEYQAIVPPRSRLDQEVKKLLKLDNIK